MTPSAIPPSQRLHLEVRRSELQARYAVLTKRIARWTPTSAVSWTRSASSSSRSAALIWSLNVTESWMN